jgi:hypothetical protein
MCLEDCFSCQEQVYCWNHPQNEIQNGQVLPYERRWFVVVDER